MNHFVVLKAVRRARRRDPRPGGRACAGCRTDELSEHFTGIALELAPAPASAASTSGARHAARPAWGRVDGLKRSLAQILALALALEAS